MLNDPGLLQAIAENGLLGTVLALFLYLWQRAASEVRVLYDKRIDDISSIRSVIDTTNLQYAAIAAATENRTRANESVADAANEMAKQLAALRDVLERTREQSDRNGQCLQELLFSMRELTAEVGRAHHAMNGEVARLNAAVQAELKDLQDEVRRSK